MTRAWVWIWQDLKRHWGWTLFFILNLALGLTGFVTVESYRDAIERHLENNSRSILSADLSVSARRKITDQEWQLAENVLQKIAPGFQVSTSYDFFAMLQNPLANSVDGVAQKLVLVKVIDDFFPLYGELVLGSPKISSLKDYKIWMYPELQQQMNLSLSQQVRLGDLNLTFSNTVVKDNTMTFRSATFAPRVFIHKDLVPQSGLLRFGSTFTMSYLIKIPEGIDREQVQGQLLQALPDPAINIETAATAGEDAGRQLNYLTDFLGLVSVIALFLAVIGASYIFNLFLNKKVFDISVLRVLGVQSKETLFLYTLEILTLGVLGFLISLPLSLMFLPLLTNTMKQWVPFALNPTVSIHSLIWGCCVSIVASLLMALPFFVKLQRLKPAQLIAESKFANTSVWKKNNFLQILKNISLFVPTLLFFLILSVYQSRSWIVGSLFIGFGLILALLVWLMNMGLSAVLVQFFNRSIWPIKYSLLGLHRRTSSTVALLMALTLGSLMINVLPQLKTTLLGEFVVGEKSKLPSLFMFDIQDEQVKGVAEVVKDQAQKDVLFYPMVRGRILKINNQDYERKTLTGSFRTREEEIEARFRNRGVNLSYRLSTLSSESIIEGKPLTGVFDSTKQTLAEISVEKRFAQRLGLKIGDEILFDVQGIEIPAKVVNLRSVKWASFNPNFFIVMQPGVLEEAPKTFIASVPAVDTNVKLNVLQKLNQTFSNVSVLDVNKTVQDVLNVAEQMSWSLELMAALGILTGYVVLFSVLQSQLKTRRWELNLLKILGSQSKDLRLFLFLEMGLVTLFCSCWGVLGSWALSMGLSIFVFDIQPTLNIFWPLLTTALMVIVSLLLSYFISYSSLRESPQSILRAEA